jgi:hypothetical protein
VAAWGQSGRLVGAAGVEFEAADEFMVDEHGGVGVVEQDVGGLSAVGDTDVDSPWSDADDAVGLDDGVGAALAGGQRDVETGHRWCRLPALEGDDAADATVGSLEVVVVAEGVELGLQLGEVGGQGLFAQPTS